jgi:hypothetical protein
MQYGQKGTAGKETERKRNFSHKQYPLFMIDKRACVTFGTSDLNFYTFRMQLSSFFIKCGGFEPDCHPEFINSFFTML